MSKTVVINKSEGWYTKDDVIEVEDFTTWFRGADGGKRYKHFIATETEKVGSITTIRLIDCRHAKVIKKKVIKNC